MRNVEITQAKEEIEAQRDEIERQRHIILGLKNKLAVCIAERKVVERQMRMKGETET